MERDLHPSTSTPRTTEATKEKTAKEDDNENATMFAVTTDASSDSCKGGRRRVVLDGAVARGDGADWHFVRTIPCGKGDA